MPPKLKPYLAVMDVRSNRFRWWNKAKGSAERGENPANASNRVYEGIARLRPSPPTTRLARDSRVFTMGSCFAREIETALIHKGGNVVSMDRDAIATPAFLNEAGVFSSGFFHRFTPAAMLQEFQRAFDELPEWTDDSLLLERATDTVVDLNYWLSEGMPLTWDAAHERRKIAKALVRRAADADVIIVTLGLTESFLHIPTGLHVNRLDPAVAARIPEQFAFQRLTYADTLACLDGIKAVLDKHHRTGRFQLVVTVSPVPLQFTFSGEDIVIANMQSKATLRAAATAFTDATDNAFYFPSYEMVIHSEHAAAWRPDRLHVRAEMVTAIVGSFVDTYYEADAFA
jgi:hypothetical protein